MTHTSTTDQIVWGISALGHDAAISVLRNNELVFAAHAERYSRVKNDDKLNQQIIDEALHYGAPDKIVWFENPVLKNARMIKSGEILYTGFVKPQKHLSSFDKNLTIDQYVNHHESHVAAGFYTSKFNDATAICIDAIGEFDTTSIWECKNKRLTKIESKSYPHSIGLFYSAVTAACGLKPNEDEYILMGMAAYGDLRYYDTLRKACFNESLHWDMKVNLHKGLPITIHPDDYCHYAAAAQKIVEEYVLGVVEYVLKTYESRNIILCGGVALNCVANSKILEKTTNVWIFPNPGDAGSSLGAALAFTKTKIDLQNMYLRK